MSLILTILAIIAAICLLLLFTVGIFMALGIFLVVGGVALIGALIFGGFSLSDLSLGKLLNNDDALKVPQAFNECLLNEQADLCRQQFTHWESKDLALVEQLAQQVRGDLGKRSEDINISSIQSNSVNGDKTVTLEAKTDFAKKKGVREHYVLTSDPKDEKHPIKIEELKWDY